MNENQNNHDHFDLRRSIMDMLYRTFKEYPYLAVEMKQIEDECHIDIRTLNWNMVYLEKCGYIELGKSYDCEPYIAPFATLTAEGIDLIEDRPRFNEKFPSSDA